MPSRLAELLRPRTLLLVLASWVGRRALARLRPAAGGAPPVPPARLPEPYRFPEPLLGAAILGAGVLFTVGWLGWVGLRTAAQTRAVAIALTHGDPDRAPLILIRYGCAGCHTIPGVPGADGKVAAPLTGLRARVYVGGVLPNTADNLRAWIVDPPAYSPRTAMPVTGITDAEARDVAAYLYMH